MCLAANNILLMCNWNCVLKWKMADCFPDRAVREWLKYENKLGNRMIKQLLNLVIAKYYNLSVASRPRWWRNNCDDHHSSVGRALHQYRRGHGFESRSGLNYFFQALISQLLAMCIELRWSSMSSYKYMIFHIIIHLHSTPSTGIIITN